MAFRETQSLSASLDCADQLSYSLGQWLGGGVRLNFIRQRRRIRFMQFLYQKYFSLVLSFECGFEIKYTDMLCNYAATTSSTNHSLDAFPFLLPAALSSVSAVLVRRLL